MDSTYILTLTIVIAKVFLKNAVKTFTQIKEIVNAIAKNQQLQNALRDICEAKIPDHASAMHPKFAMMKTNTSTQKFVVAFAAQSSVLIISSGMMSSVNANVLQLNARITSIGMKKHADASANIENAQITFQTDTSLTKKSVSANPSS